MTAEQSVCMLEEESSELNGSDSDIEIDVTTTSRDELWLSHHKFTSELHIYKLFV